MTPVFDLDAYYKFLTTKSLGRPCLYYDEVVSTIETARQQPDKTLVVAKQQIRGRGQHGNTWQSPAGCAMASLKLILPKTHYTATKLCFLQHVVAVAISNTLNQLDPVRLSPRSVRLKWPNDIVHCVGEGIHKIGGILLHSENKTCDYDMTISFGINVSNKQPTVCIQDIIGRPISCDQVIACIMNNLERDILDLDTSRFNAIKDIYSDRCLQIGQIVCDETHEKIRILDVNDDGYLTGIRQSDQKFCIVTKITTPVYTGKIP